MLRLGNRTQSQRAVSDLKQAWIMLALLLSCLRGHSLETRWPSAAPRERGRFRHTRRERVSLNVRPETRGPADRPDGSSRVITAISRLQADPSRDYWSDPTPSPHRALSSGWRLVRYFRSPGTDTRGSYSRLRPDGPLSLNATAAAWRAERFKASRRSASRSAIVTPLQWNDASASASRSSRAK